MLLEQVVVAPPLNVDGVDLTRWSRRRRDAILIEIQISIGAAILPLARIALLVGAHISTGPRAAARREQKADLTAASCRRAGRRRVRRAGIAATIYQPLLIQIWMMASHGGGAPGSCSDSGGGCECDRESARRRCQCECCCCSCGRVAHVLVGVGGLSRERERRFRSVSEMHESRQTQSDAIVMGRPVADKVAWSRGTHAIHLHAFE